MQNEPNLVRRRRIKNEPNPIYERGLRQFYTPSHNEKRTQNEPNTNPNEPNQTQFAKSQNECKLTYNKGLQKKR